MEIFGMGIHYDYKSLRGERAMLKKAKREERLAKKRAKKKDQDFKEDSIMHDIHKPITLEDLTNPENKK